jgi:hypothetical protein
MAVKLVPQRSTAPARHRYGARERRGVSMAAECPNAWRAYGMKLPLRGLAGGWR